MYVRMYVHVYVPLALQLSSVRTPSSTSTVPFCILRTYIRTYVLVCTESVCTLSLAIMYARYVSSAVLWLFCRQCDQFRPCTVRMYSMWQYDVYIHTYLHTYTYVRTVNLLCLFMHATSSVLLLLLPVSAPHWRQLCGPSQGTQASTGPDMWGVWCLCMRACVCVCVLACVRTYICACVCVWYISTYMFVLVSMCVCMHKYIRTYSVCT